MDRILIQFCDLPEADIAAINRSGKKAPYLVVALDAIRNGVKIRICQRNFDDGKLEEIEGVYKSHKGWIITILDARTKLLREVLVVPGAEIHLTATAEST